MSTHQIYQFVDYVPAELHEGKEWFVAYYVKHPASGEMVRKKVKCNRIRSIPERRKFARILVDEINGKLRSGWNPFLEQEAPKSFHRVKTGLEAFISYCRLAVQNNELRPDTLRTYNSYTELLSQWLRISLQEDIFIINFSEKIARDYLTYCYNTKRVKPRTYNNYIKGYTRIFNWLMKNGYTRVNPFLALDKKQCGHKIRIQYMETQIRNRISEFLGQHNYRFMVCCLLAYHCLIRPKEITYLKIKWIDMDKQQIKIPADVSKNKSTRYATIPDSMMKALEKLQLKKEDPDNYLFSIGMLPGSERLNPRRIAKYWAQLRKDISLDKEYQFYSLRDSGIIQKIKDGIPIDEVMYQADHHSLETTNVYVRIANPEIFRNVKEMASRF